MVDHESLSKQPIEYSCELKLPSYEVRSHLSTCQPWIYSSNVKKSGIKMPMLFSFTIDKN